MTSTGVQTGTEVLRIDGAEPISADLLARVSRACDRAESADGRVVVHATGTPEGSWAQGLTVAQVNRWERAVRRLERLPAVTVAIVDGDCGGTALDLVLAADIRIATPAARLTVPLGGGATWPGMALFRLVRQGSNATAVRRAALFGEPIGALDALALHLVDDVTEDVTGALAAAEATRCVSGPELAVRRQLLADAATVSFEEALGVHLAACDRELRRLTAEPAR
ncbi:isomerase DpgB [Catenulispora sp. MAP12-49]|uniref:enoyl-CoA-hydratase DpgB n=1 Tax=unclassified Catenulispora TaxID=414885 RepID=UPI003517B426